MRLIALVLLGVIATPIAPATAAMDTDRCMAVVDNYTYRLGDKDLAPVVNFLNNQVSHHVAAQESNPLALKAAKPIDRDIEVLEVEVSSKLCGEALATQSMAKAGPGMTANPGCNQAGCTENPPPDFDTIPPNGTVSIASCGRGIRTISDYRKESDGVFVMRGYETRRVNQCAPT